MKIGEGSFGEVFKVKSKDDGKYYAIKRTKERYRSDADRALKVAEVCKYENIPTHDHCVALIFAWEEDGRVYIQMELGCTSLDVYAEHNPGIDEDRLWNILLDVLLVRKCRSCLFIFVLNNMIFLTVIGILLFSGFTKFT